MRLVVIKHILDLAIRVFDTATGQAVPPASVALFRNGELVHPTHKPGGHFVLMQLGRNNFLLTIQAQGYLTQTVTVDYATLDTAKPYMAVQLIPDRPNGPPYAMLEITGKREGLKAISGVSLDNIDCFIQSYDPKRKLMTISNSHNRNFERQNYARLNVQMTCFEPFQVMDSQTPLLLEIKDDLQKEFSNLCPIQPIVLGKVLPSGEYWLRVRDDGNNPHWLIRYQMTDGDIFENITLGKATDLTANGGAVL